MEKVIQRVKLEPRLQYKFIGLTKRCFDIIFSLALCFLVTPLVLLFALFIRLDSPGSPFYFQERLGMHGKSFQVIKLRSMNLNAEVDGIQWAHANDPRVTRIGKFIRRTRIDELPQLINILKGDMSLVGPRPERAYFYDEFMKTYPQFYLRLDVKPGLTGLAQVNGGYELSPGEKLEYDLKYIQTQSFWLDLKVLMKTAQVVISGHGAR